MCGWTFVNQWLNVALARQFCRVLAFHFVNAQMYQITVPETEIWGWSNSWKQFEEEKCNVIRLWPDHLWVLRWKALSNLIRRNYYSLLLTNKYVCFRLIWLCGFSPPCCYVTWYCICIFNYARYRAWDCLTNYTSNIQH